MLAPRVVAAGTIFLQVKPLFSAEIVQPKFEKLNPVEGFKNIFFKSKTYIELVKNLVKLTVVLALAYLRDPRVAARRGADFAHERGGHGRDLGGDGRGLSAAGRRGVPADRSG